jgi:hypothetical protein
MSEKPFAPKFAVLPVAWGARVDYTKWTDRFVPKTELIAHYGGGGNGAGEFGGEFPHEEIGNPPPRPKFLRHPWLWIRWRKSQEFLDQVAKEKAQLRSWEAYHIDGHGWRGIAYGFAIGQSGTVYALRGYRNLEGAQYNSDDLDGDGTSSNEEGIAIVFILGGNQDATVHAWKSYRKMYRWVKKQGGGAPITRSYHAEVARAGGHSTSCCGPKLIPRVIAWRGYP